LKPVFYLWLRFSFFTKWFGFLNMERSG